MGIEIIAGVTLGVVLAIAFIISRARKNRPRF
jgi:MFS superfamily sulfate permease-like transporter